jgi:ATP-dependent Clp protease protease subunit
MGSLIATSGAIGKRYMLPHATHMIHQPSGGFSGQATDGEIRLNELLRWKHVLTNIYQEQTQRPYDGLVADMERDNFMTADMSIAYNLADEIVKTRKK